MELAAIATIACGLTAVSVIVLGALAVIVVTTGGRGLIDRFGGMIGLGGGGNDDPMPQRERRVRPSGRSSNLRARAQNLSFDQAVQAQGGNLPSNNQQQGSGNDSPPMQQQSLSAQASGIQPSRPALSPSRPFQGSSSGGSSQRNQPQQNQPRQQLQRNWGDTLNGRQAAQSQRPQAQNQPQGQQQNRQPQQNQNQPRQPQQNQQRQDPLQPSLRGGQQWQGNWGDTLNPQQAGQPQRQQNQNQPQQKPQQNQQNQNQQQGGLGDYRPQLRAKPGANTQQNDNRWNRGRDSRHGDDYDRLYDDGDGGFFEDG